MKVAITVSLIIIGIFFYGCDVIKEKLVYMDISSNKNLTFGKYYISKNGKIEIVMHKKETLPLLSSIKGINLQNIKLTKKDIKINDTELILKNTVEHFSNIISSKTDSCHQISDNYDVLNHNTLVKLHIFNNKNKFNRVYAIKESELIASVFKEEGYMLISCSVGIDEMKLENIFNLLIEKNID